MCCSRTGRGVGTASCRTPLKAAGFTLPELIIVMILGGILAAVILPKISAVTAVQSDNWRDQVSAAVRYAQKAAISHRRLVCMSVSSGAVALQIAATRGSVNCSTNLSGIDGSASFGTSASNAATVSVSPGGTLYFQPDGRVTTDAAGASSATFTFSFTGASSLSLYGETGYVQ